METSLKCGLSRTIAQGSIKSDADSFLFSKMVTATLKSLMKSLRRAFAKLLSYLKEKFVSEVYQDSSYIPSNATTSTTGAGAIASRSDEVAYVPETPIGIPDTSTTAMRRDFSYCSSIFEVDPICLSICSESGRVPPTSSIHSKNAREEAAASVVRPSPLDKDTTLVSMPQKTKKSQSRRKKKSTFY